MRKFCGGILRSAAHNLRGNGNVSSKESYQQLAMSCEDCSTSAPHTGLPTVSATISNDEQQRAGAPTASALDAGPDADATCTTKDSIETATAVVTTGPSSGDEKTLAATTADVSVTLLTSSLETGMGNVDQKQEEDPRDMETAEPDVGAAGDAKLNAGAREAGQKVLEPAAATPSAPVREKAKITASPRPKRDRGKERTRRRIRREAEEAVAQDEEKIKSVEQEAIEEGSLCLLNNIVQEEKVQVALQLIWEAITNEFQDALPDGFPQRVSDVMKSLQPRDKGTGTTVQAKATSTPVGSPEPRVARQNVPKDPSNPKRASSKKPSVAANTVPLTCERSGTKAQSKLKYWSLPSNLGAAGYVQNPRNPAPPGKVADKSKGSRETKRQAEDPAEPAAAAARAPQQHKRAGDETCVDQPAANASRSPAALPVEKNKAGQGTFRRIVRKRWSALGRMLGAVSSELSPMVSMASSSAKKKSSKRRGTGENAGDGAARVDASSVTSRGSSLSGSSGSCGESHDEALESDTDPNWEGKLSATREEQTCTCKACLNELPDGSDDVLEACPMITAIFDSLEADCTERIKRLSTIQWSASVLLDEQERRLAQLRISRQTQVETLATLNEARRNKQQKKMAAVTLLGDTRRMSGRRFGVRRGASGRRIDKDPRREDPGAPAAAEAAAAAAAPSGEQPYPPYVWGGYLGPCQPVCAVNPAGNYCYLGWGDVVAAGYPFPYAYPAAPAAFPQQGPVPKQPEAGDQQPPQESDTPESEQPAPFRTSCSVERMRAGNTLEDQH